MCFCDLQCVWSPSGKTSLKINGLPLLWRRLMSLEQIPPLACDLSPTAIGVTGVEVRVWQWHPPPSPLFLAWAGGAGQPRLGSTCDSIACWRRTKVWPFVNGAENSSITWFLGRTCSFPHQTPFFRPIFKAAPLHVGFFARHLVGLRGLVWIMYVVMQHGVHLADGVHRASPKPSPAMRKAPIEAEGWDLLPWVIKPSSLYCVQPWTGACRWYCSARNKYW